MIRAMGLTTSSDIKFDPADPQMHADPYPTYRRLREEAPLYHNDERDFYVLSRFEDIDRGLVDHATYSSAKGGILELIKANIEIPSGVFIFEDPPLHSAHRGVLSRVFTPRKMNALEGQVRDFSAKALDPFVERGSLRLRARPRQHHADQCHRNASRHPRGGSASRPRAQGSRYQRFPETREYEGHNFADEAFFADYIAWRAEHPSDDLMTALLRQSRIRQARFATSLGRKS